MGLVIACRASARVCSIAKALRYLVCELHHVLDQLSMSLTQAVVVITKAPNGLVLES